MTSSDALRQIPSVGVLLEHERAAELIEKHGRERLREAIRERLGALRASLAAGSAEPIDAADILAAARAALDLGARPRLRRVVNATGVILHTGLGRAVLPEAAREAIGRELAGYASLEVDLETGRRSPRDLAVRDLLTHLTGAEDATLVNNNAAAVLLTLASLARGGEVIVSRGQLVEIGGSFRVPDVMAESGARLVEVGTTNKTRIDDFQRALTDQTALLLAVHTSNFRVIGFTESVPIEQLVLLGKERGIPVMHDVGSGALRRFHGVEPALDPEAEPAVDYSIECGVDIVTSSTDKLLGGPQGGLIVGRAERVEAIRRHPLARALRVDKLQLVALESTLRLYGDLARARQAVPALRMMSMPLEEIAGLAGRLAARIADEVPGARVALEDESSCFGSGSLPEEALPTRVVVVSLEAMSAEQLSSALRAHEVPVFARIVRDRVLIDPRTLLDGDDEILLGALRSVARSAVE